MRTTSRKSIRSIPVIYCLFSLGFIGVGQISNGAEAETSNLSKSALGNTWDSIKRLPDWSGVWALDLYGHLFAGKESLANDKSSDGGLVPLTPKYMKLRADAHTVRAQENLSFCLPAGVPGVMLHTIQMEFLFTPGRVTLITENGEVRRIYTDGRPHLSLDDLTESYEGDSTGHWEGNTLVVDTVGFPRGSLFQNYGVLATLHTHYVERIHLKDKDHLQIDSVIDDPAIFTKPYSASRTYERLNLLMQEPQCSQTNRDDGKTVDLTPPPQE